MALVQEFVLTCFLLAGHRAARLEELDYNRRQQHGIAIDGGIHSSRLLTSLGLIWFTLIVAVVQNRFANSKRYSIRHRFTDFLLMAILLRFLSAVLKTLTASYSSDTVYALSTVSLFLHLLTCDYDYANGLDDDDDDDDNSNNDDDDCTDCSTTISRSIGGSYRNKNLERPTFKGGMMSLTSAFFATTLLASRLESNVAVYIFVCSSVILFALYPAARHLVAVKARHVGKWGKFLARIQGPRINHEWEWRAAKELARPEHHNSFLFVSMIILQFLFYVNNSRIHCLRSTYVCFRNSHIGIDYLVRANRNFDGINDHIVHRNFRSNLEVLLTVLQSEAERTMGYSSCIKLIFASKRHSIGNTIIQIVQYSEGYSSLQIAWDKPLWILKKPFHFLFQYEK